MEQGYLSGLPPALAPVGPLWFHAVASLMAVATLRRLASTPQSMNLRLQDAAGMGTTYPEQSLEHVGDEVLLLVAVLRPELADVGRLRRLLR